MSQTAVYYLTATGEIVDIFSWSDTDGPTQFATLVPAGGAYALDEEATIDGSYYPAGVKTDRPLVADDNYHIADDGVDSVTFAMPSGTVITPDYYLFTQQTSVAENFVFTSTISGQFNFDLAPPFPYQTQTIRIYVNDDNV